MLAAVVGDPGRAGVVARHERAELDGGLTGSGMPRMSTGSPRLMIHVRCGPGRPRWMPGANPSIR